MVPMGASKDCTEELVDFLMFGTWKSMFAERFEFRVSSYRFLETGRHFEKTAPGKWLNDVDFRDAEDHTTMARILRTEQTLLGLPRTKFLQESGSPTAYCKLFCVEKEKAT